MNWGEILKGEKALSQNPNFFFLYLITEKKNQG